jgi:hypothetical protein
MSSYTYYVEIPIGFHIDKADDKDHALKIAHDTIVSFLKAEDINHHGVIESLDWKTVVKKEFGFREFEDFEDE